MNERIKNKLTAIRVGYVTTLWSLLIWRVSDNAFAVGHNSVNVASGPYYDLDKAASEVERLMD